MSDRTTKDKNRGCDLGKWEREERHQAHGHATVIMWRYNGKFECQICSIVNNFCSSRILSSDQEENKTTRLTVLVGKEETQAHRKGEPAFLWTRLGSNWGSLEFLNLEDTENNVAVRKWRYRVYPDRCYTNYNRTGIRVKQTRSVPLRVGCPHRAMIVG